MDEMNRLLRGLPEPEADEQQQDNGPKSGREWFDRVVLGRGAETPAGGGDAA